MTTPSKLQTDISSVDLNNAVTPETINEAALQYVYGVGDVDTAYTAEEPEIVADPIMTIMPVGEAIIIEVPQSIATLESEWVAKIAGDDAIDYFEEEAPTDGEVYEEVLVDDLILTIMPVDEGIIIDEAPIDELGGSDGDVIETLPEDITDLVLVDPIFTILPAEDYIFLDDMETTPEESGFYEEIIDVLADPETGLPSDTDIDPLDPLVMAKPWIWDWSRDRDSGTEGEITEETGADDLETPSEDITDLVLVDPILTIMPVDEGTIIEDVTLDEMGSSETDGEILETPPEDFSDLVLIDPIYTILPVEDYIFLDEMETTPEEIIDVVIDPETGLPLETNGDISFENLDLGTPEESFNCILFMCNLTVDEIVFSTEEPILDKGFTDIDPGAVTEIRLLGLPETIEFIA